jgi:hypothetical protein
MKVNSIIQQIRDDEFNKELNNREENLKKQLQLKHELELKSKEDEVKLLVTKSCQEELDSLHKEKGELEKENIKLNSKIERFETEKKLAVNEAVLKVEKEKQEIQQQLTDEKEMEKMRLAQKDELIDYYKDLKTKMSTKMVGETLEQHCEIEFNKLRPTAFKNAYFEKDNDTHTGSKGDYIYREIDQNGVEIISIMFEMKNQMDETATKHKNEDFLKSWIRTVVKKSVNMQS